MNLLIETIYKMNPSVVRTEGTYDAPTAYDAHGNLVDFNLAEAQAEVARLQALEPIRIAEANRRAAYIAEADPLFFKAQRGEATVQEWQDKVAEIKARYPKEAA